MTSVTVDYLIPNKDYEFKVVLKTNNKIESDDIVDSGDGNGDNTEDGESGAVTLPEHGGPIFLPEYGGKPVVPSDEEEEEKAESISATPIVPAALGEQEETNQDGTSSLEKSRKV